MSASSGANFGFGFGVKLASGTGPSPGSSGHVLVELLAMLAVLCFIFTYCCWGAVGPYCRLFCRRQCGCGAENDLESTEAINPSLGPSGSSDRSGFHSHQTPTIILLPQGRMLVVDGSVFTQFQADRNGLDFMDLGESVLRAERNRNNLSRQRSQNSQNSIIDAEVESPSKDSISSVGWFPPPTYESIYGKEIGDMPPSYSDILFHRFENETETREDRDKSDQSRDDYPRIIANPGCPDNPDSCNNNQTRLEQPRPERVTSFVSQSLPRRISKRLRRNPSLVSNPLDTYYMDTEAAMQRFQNPSIRPRRIISCSNLENCSNFEQERLQRSSLKQGATSRPPSVRIEVTSSEPSTSSMIMGGRADDDLQPGIFRTSNAMFMRTRSDESDAIDDTASIRAQRRLSMDQITWNLNSLDLKVEMGNNLKPDNRSELRRESDVGNEDALKTLTDIRESRV